MGVYFADTGYLKPLTHGRMVSEQCRCTLVVQGVGAGNKARTPGRQDAPVLSRPSALVPKRPIAKSPPKCPDGWAAKAAERGHVNLGPRTELGPN